MSIPSIDLLELVRLLFVLLPSSSFCASSQSDSNHLLLHLQLILLAGRAEQVGIRIFL